MGPDEHVYPWGDAEADSTRAAYGRLRSSDSLLPVGSKPAGDSWKGHSDLSGNVREWVVDWFVPALDDCNNCVVTTRPHPSDGTSPHKVIRGGGIAETSQRLRNDSRGSDVRGYQEVDLGFRCARSP